VWNSEKSRPIIFYCFTLVLWSRNTETNLFSFDVFLFSQYCTQIPHSLFKEDGYDHREALFGKPAYGGSIAQNVYYAQQDFCTDAEANPSKGVPTRPDDPETGKMAAWPSPFILMIDRGNCTFVKKVRNFFEIKHISRFVSCGMASLTLFISSSSRARSAMLNAPVPPVSLSPTILVSAMTWNAFKRRN
jgi:hypothetical protein